MAQEQHPTSSDMDTRVLSVEKILGYTFNNKKLLEDALTHKSYTESPSYERLEFVGDAVLGLMLAEHFYSEDPELDQQDLTLLRKYNANNETLAHVALRKKLHLYVRFDSLDIADQIQQFGLNEEEDVVVHAGAGKFPPILADIVESVIAAVYFDCSCDLKLVWQVTKSLLEPLVTLETVVEHKIREVEQLFRMQKKQVDIRECKENYRNVFRVSVQGKLIARKAFFTRMDIVAFRVLEELTNKLNESEATSSLDAISEVNDMNENESPRDKLRNLCKEKKWPQPTFSLEKETGSAHDRKVVYSVEIKIADLELHMSGEEKTRKKTAQDSAASSMLRFLDESKYL